LTVVVSISVVTEDVLCPSEGSVSDSVSFPKPDIGDSSSSWIIVDDALLLDAANSVCAIESEKGMDGRETDGNCLWRLRSCGIFGSRFSRADESDEDDDRSRFCCKFLVERDLERDLERPPAFS